MKWYNKGNEFNEIGFKLNKYTKILLYGAGDYGQKMYEILNRLNIFVEFIDSNKEKQKNGYLNCKVISPNELLYHKDKKLVVICAIPQYAREMEKKLLEEGYVKNVNYYMMDDFINILPIYSVYVLDKVFMECIGFLPTTKCNLNCEGCLNFTNFNKNKKHQPLEELKQTLDLYFKNINCVNFFSFTGGEPLLYPYIDEILEYIGEKYMPQIISFAMSTNCTLVPKNSTCEILKKYNMKVYIDDYSEYVEKSKMILEEISKKFSEYDIIYAINKNDGAYWIDLAPDITDNSFMMDSELEDYRTRCGVPYRELRNGKIYSCNYASFAIKAGLEEENPNDYYDLEKHSPDKNKELVEFLLGYTEKGYVDFCKHCAGFLPINPYKKPVGKQIIRN